MHINDVNRAFMELKYTDLKKFFPDVKLKKRSKDELIQAIQPFIENKKDLVKEIFKQFERELALYPFDVEEMLTITKTERKRWTDNEILNVVYYREIRKGGLPIYIDVPLYDRYQILTTNQSDIDHWREEDKKAAQDNRKIGAKKAAETRKRNIILNKEIEEKRIEEAKILEEKRRVEEIERQEKQKEFLNNLEKDIITWESVSENLATTFVLAFWTLWLSRLAKQRGNNEELYKQKNKAIKLLLKSPFASVKYYEPADSDRVFIHMCGNHYREWDYPSKTEKIELYFSDEFIQDCPDCDMTIISDYYSLYYLELSCNYIPGIYFSLHTPVPIGEFFFPKKETLEILKFKENEREEGLYNLKEPIYPNKLGIFNILTKDFVLEKFEAAMEQYEEMKIQKYEEIKV